MGPHTHPGPQQPAYLSIPCPEPPDAGDEVATLVGFPEYQRATLAWKCRGLDAEAALFVCGERPGLGFADSLSAYYIYRPGPQATDANRHALVVAFPPISARPTNDAAGRIFIIIEESLTPLSVS